MIDEFFVNVLAKSTPACAEIVINADATWKEGTDVDSSDDEDDRPAAKRLHLDGCVVLVLLGFIAPLECTFYHTSVSCLPDRHKLPRKLSRALMRVALVGSLLFACLDSLSTHLFCLLAIANNLVQPKPSPPPLLLLLPSHRFARLSQEPLFPSLPLPHRLSPHQSL